MSRTIQANTRSVGVHASNAPTIIACAVVMIAPGPPALSTVPNSGVLKYAALVDAPRFSDTPVACSAPSYSLGSCTTVGLFLVRDRRFGAFVQPSPISSVSFPLPFVVLAAPGRTKLRELPAESHQPEGAVAVAIFATTGHEGASALDRSIKRMKFSCPRPRQERPQ